jgi:hypothetical protein
LPPIDADDAERPPYDELVDKGSGEALAATLLIISDRGIATKAAIPSSWPRGFTAD